MPRKTLIFLTCATVLAAGSLLAGETPAKDFKYYFNGGNDAMDAGRWSEAMEMLAKAEEMAGTDKNGRSPAANCQGLVCMKRRQWQEGVSHFERSIDYNAENKTALNSLGLSYVNIYQYGLGDIDQLKLAVETYEKLAAVDPDYRAANRALAKKMLAEAEALAAKQSNEVGELPEGTGYKHWVGVGDEAEANAQFARAMACYAKAEEQSAGSKHWAANRQGLCVMRQRKFGEAASHFERAITLSTEPSAKQAVIYNSLGTAYLNLFEGGASLSDLESAISAFTKASELNASDSRFSGNLAAAQSRLDKERQWAAAASEDTDEKDKKDKKQKK